MALNYAKEQISIVLGEIDTNKDGIISKDEFVHLMNNQKAMNALTKVGVDVVALVDFADYFFQSDKHGREFNVQWEFDTFMDHVLQLRGARQSTVRDTVELRKFIH